MGGARAEHQYEQRVWHGRRSVTDLKTTLCIHNQPQWFVAIAAILPTFLPLPP